jgi:hypothetical protein
MRVNSSDGALNCNVIIQPVGTWSTMTPTRQVSLECSSGDLSVWWRRSLEIGAAVFLDGEPVYLKVDMELGCLEVREHELLYPLAELQTCEQRACDSSADAYVGSYECIATFAELDALRFQFSEAAQRDGFVSALNELAQEAQQGTLPAVEELLPPEEEEDRALPNEAHNLPKIVPAKAVATESHNVELVFAGGE